MDDKPANIDEQLGDFANKSDKKVPMEVITSKLAVGSEEEIVITMDETQNNVFVEEGTSFTVGKEEHIVEKSTIEQPKIASGVNSEEIDGPTTKTEEKLGMENEQAADVSSDDSMDFDRKMEALVAEICDDDSLVSSSTSNTMLHVGQKFNSQSSKSVVDDFSFYRHTTNIWNVEPGNLTYTGSPPASNNLDFFLNTNDTKVPQSSLLDHFQYDGQQRQVRSWCQVPSLRNLEHVHFRGTNYEFMPVRRDRVAVNTNIFITSFKSWFKPILDNDIDLLILAICFFYFIATFYQ